MPFVVRCGLIASTTEDRSAYLELNAGLVLSLCAPPIAACAFASAVASSLMLSLVFIVILRCQFVQQRVNRVLPRILRHRRRAVVGLGCVVVARGHVHILISHQFATSAATITASASRL